MSTAQEFPRMGFWRKLSDYIGTPAIVQGNAVWLPDPHLLSGLDLTEIDSYCTD